MSRVRLLRQPETGGFSSRLYLRDENPMRAIQSLLVTSLAIGSSCSRDHTPTTASTSSHPGGSSQPVATTERAADAPDASVGANDPDTGDPSWKKPVEQYVDRLRAASLAPDPKAFAKLLAYPVHVNTVSRCTAVISSAATFTAHFDEILRGRVAAALNATHKAYFDTWQGVSFGDGSVWLDTFDESKPKVTAFNADVWRIGGLSCAGEPESAAPQWLGGMWQVTSVAILQGGQFVTRTPTTWIGKTIDIDMRHRTAALHLEEGPDQSCAMGRFGTRNTVGLPRALDAAYAGLVLSRTTQFLDLECKEADTRTIKRVELINRTALAVVGDDKYLLVLRRGKQIMKRSTGAATTDSSCGSSQAACPSGQVCTASRSPRGSLVESCADIN